MIGFRYSEWDSTLYRRLQDFKTLRELFNFLLLKTSGDPERALELMRHLQQRGYLDPSIDVDRFCRELEARELIAPDEDGELRLTDRGVQSLRRSSLESIFRDLKAGGPAGGHPTPYAGGANRSEALPERRHYEFGDDVRSIDFTESLWNAVRRTGSTDSPFGEDDLVVFDSEFSTSCATVLLLDISHSMVLYGEDRFTPAKQVALALTELILMRFHRDTLDVVLFGDDAVPVEIAELPFVEVGPYHTNTKAGIASARRILERRKNPNKQIFIVTDGKPTVIDVPGEGVYRNTFGFDDRIVNRTLDEAVVCRRKGITITTFMVTRDPYLQQFVVRLTELNRGRAYFSSPDSLGGFVFLDFIRNRKRNVRPDRRGG
jgi:uncharacterized protein with von Willebrand factor type A (vWA) domain